MNGCESLVQIAGSGGGSGILYGSPVVLHPTRYTATDDHLYILSSCWYPVSLTEVSECGILPRVKSALACKRPVRLLV